MTMMNRYLFEVELKQKHQNFKEIYSIEQIDELIQNNRMMADEIQDLKLRCQNIEILQKNE